MVKTGDIHVMGHAYGGFFEPSVASVGADFDMAFVADVGGIPSYRGVFVDRNVTTLVQDPIGVFIGGTQLDLPPIGNPMTIGNIDGAVPPAIGAGGHVAHTMIVTQSGGPNPQVLLRKNPFSVPVDLVSFDGKEVVPGVSTDLIGAAAIPFGLSSTGEVGFRAPVTGGAGGTAILRADTAGTIEVVARTGDNAPGTSDTFNVIAGQTNNAYVAEFNSTVRSAFRATTNGPSANGVWVDTGTGVVKIADNTTLADGSLLPYKNFEAPAVSDSGLVAFRGCLNFTCTMDGIWSTGPLGLKKVAIDGNGAPDSSGSTAGGDTFVGFGNPVLNGPADLAFRGTVNPGSVQGIWQRSNSGSGLLLRLVKNLDPLRGTSLTFASFGTDMAIVDSGQLAFTATMSDGLQGLFVTAESGAIIKIVKVGEAFSISPTDMRTISFIDFYPGSPAQGNSGFTYNTMTAPKSAGVVYRLQFLDMSVAIVLTTLQG